VVGFELVSLALALMLPMGAYFVYEETILFVPCWAAIAWALSIPIGTVSLIVLLVARRLVRQSGGRLRGGILLDLGLFLAATGTWANSAAFVFAAMSTGM
jgi:hypothetical protein